MKRLFSILSAALVVFATLSCQREELVVFDPSSATAPVLGTYTVDASGVSANFTPGSFEGTGLNEKLPVNHALAIVSVNDEQVNAAIASKVESNTVSASVANISNTLLTLGFKEDDTVSMELVVRCSNLAKVGNAGYVDSEGRITVTGFVVTIPKGSPYADYTQKAEDWTVIGALSNYGINWDGDLVMWTDGNGNYVAPHVTLSAADEFKFRKDQDWAVNYGGPFGSVGAEISVSQNGDNIKVGADGVYDLFLYTGTEKAVVAEAYDPYPEFTKESNWSVIGALSAYGISWDGDIDMVSDGTSHVALNVSIKAADEFKFRQDKAWTVNLGGAFSEVGSDFSVAQNGDNIKIGTDGTYDLFVNPDAGTAKVVAASGLMVSTKFVTEEDPGSESATKYSLIGEFNSWGDDIDMTESSGIWTGYFETDKATTFKIRKDHDWAVSYGASEANVDFYDNDGENDSYKPVLDEAFAAGGTNVYVEAGIWKVVLDLTDADNPTITVSVGEAWTIIGDFNSWGGDVDMTADGKVWTGYLEVDNATTFKIRKNKGWDVSYGGGAANLDFYDNDGNNDSYKPVLGEAFTAGSTNIYVTAGEWKIVLDLTDAEKPTITVSSRDSWTIIGDFNSWGGDVDMTVDSRVWTGYLEVENATTFKIRKNKGWDVSYGGGDANIDFYDNDGSNDSYKPVLGEAFAAGGTNIYVEAGSWKIVLNLTDAEKPTITVSANTKL